MEKAWLDNEGRCPTCRAKTAFCVCGTPKNRAARTAASAKVGPPSSVEAAGKGLHIQIASDLHLEFYDGIRPKLSDILEPVAAVLALVGDICTLTDDDGREVFEDFIEQCAKAFEMVLFVAGNHEFYCRRDETSIASVFEYLRSLQAKVANLRVLENDAVMVGGVKIIGTTLWSHVPDKQTIEGARLLGADTEATVEYCLNDYHCVYVDAPTGKRQLTVKDTNALHSKALEFISQEIHSATASRTPMLVLTHHTPSFRGTSAPWHSSDPDGMACGFSTDLESLFATPDTLALRTWVFGHTHWNSDQEIRGVRVVSNQRGYPEEVDSNYRRDKTLEVSDVWMPTKAQ